MLALIVAIPISVWISRRAGDALHQHDAALDRVDLDRVAACVPGIEAADALGQIDALIQQEVALIREILDERASGAHVTPEHVQELRQIHRRGLALRQRCGDSALDAEVAWLQGYGSVAMMSDLSDFDRAAFERDLAFRADEVRRAVDLQRRRSTHRAGIQAA
jgi:hypothetical protein